MKSCVLIYTEDLSGKENSQRKLGLDFGEVEAPDSLLTANFFPQ